MKPVMFRVRTDQVTFDDYTEVEKYDGFIEIGSKEIEQIKYLVQTIKNLDNVNMLRANFKMDLADEGTGLSRLKFDDWLAEADQAMWKVRKPIKPEKFHKTISSFIMVFKGGYFFFSASVDWNSSCGEFESAIFTLKDLNKALGEK